MAFGGYCLQTGHFFRHELLAEEKSRFWGSNKHVTGFNDIRINVLELLDMLVGAWMLVVAERRRSVTAGDSVLLRGDNEPNVAWIWRCRGGKEPRFGALMRMLERSRCLLDGTSIPCMFQVFLTPSLTVSRDGMLLTCMLTLLRHVLTFDGDRWILGRTGGRFAPPCWPRGAGRSCVSV